MTSLILFSSVEQKNQRWTVLPVRLWPATKSSLLLAGGLKLLELSLGLKGSVDGTLGLARLCSKLSERRSGSSCWTRPPPVGEATLPCGLP
jgi:hypothetical protein